MHPCARASVSAAADKEEQLLSNVSQEPLSGFGWRIQKRTRHMPPLSATCCDFPFYKRRFLITFLNAKWENSDESVWGSVRLTLSCVFASFWMLSNVYFSDLLWRILKSREPLLDCRDSSSSMMSLGMLSFFPRSIKSSVHKTQTFIFMQQKRGEKRFCCNFTITSQFIHF